ncbi:efflux RND transporter periplasmic adaptor subunit [Massilia alkalitolerans]|uniref:efflux RND transporter periplasmic adaptor subunit n=1 Tax=Massilia alkalitolerans TaxID=286638 RepID=UPI00041C0249|nr:efflux RND transporter periplasmic adaptor subunit [Massilia alkalitolerans]
MNTKRIVGVVLVAGAAAVAGYGLYWLGEQNGAKMGKAGTVTGTPTQPPGGDGMVDPATGRRVLYWHDPMVPGQRFDKPGKSPFMDMQLVPVFADEAGGQGGVAIDPRLQQNLGMRTAEVTKSSMTQAVEAVGNVAYNERDVTLVQARSNGFVERLHVRAPLDPVRKGQPLAELYVPEWIAVQEEYLAVRRMTGSGTDAMADAARQRMRLAGMTEDQVRRVVSSGKVVARVTLSAPASGVVTDLAVREGMTVSAGAPLFRINGLDRIWVNAEVPEALSGQVRPGVAVEAHTPVMPGAVFKGKVSAVLPDVSATTRTLKARVELANTGHQLVPGMFANVVFVPAAREDVLSVPTESVILTGQRSLVILAEDKGRFRPVDVEVGAETGDRTEIRKGLEAGQRVVVSGQFLIDSEASLRGVVSRMNEAAQAGVDAKAGTEAPVERSDIHKAEGKVEAIGKDSLTLSHGPVASLKWPAMTMDFQFAPDVLPAGVKVGDTVSFEFRQTPEGEYAITRMVRTSGGGTGAGG